jgi:FtsP/CotA-like multicopper oxidase with cupredoxin domain
MKDMGMGDMGGGDMAGMSIPAGPNMAAVRGIDPSAEQNASGNLWKLTGWKEPTDHGTVKAAAAAAGTAMAGMAGMAQGSMAGMDHSAMGHGTAQPPASTGSMTAMPGMDHGSTQGADHGSMNMRDFSKAPQVRKGPGVQTISPMPADRTGEPPQGLEGMDHRVMTYRDLVALDRNPDLRAPSRSLELHLTGNMERFMWGFDGQKMSDPADPIPFRLNERVRVTLINDTMMAHPIHIHGHFFELVTGHGAHGPRKHTVLVQPGGKVTWDFTADAVGDWAFHCHLLYHMSAGMMRVVTIRPLVGDSQNAAS